MLLCNNLLGLADLGPNRADRRGSPQKGSYWPDETDRAADELGNAISPSCPHLFGIIFCGAKREHRPNSHRLAKRKHTSTNCANFLTRKLIQIKNCAMPLCDDLQVGNPAFAAIPSGVRRFAQGLVPHTLEQATPTQKEGTNFRLTAPCMLRACGQCGGLRR